MCRSNFLRTKSISRGRSRKNASYLPGRSRQLLRRIPKRKPLALGLPTLPSMPGRRQFRRSRRGLPPLNLPFLRPAPRHRPRASLLPSLLSRSRLHRLQLQKLFLKGNSLQPRRRLPSLLFLNRLHLLPLQKSFLQGNSLQPHRRLRRLSRLRRARPCPRSRSIRPALPRPSRLPCRGWGP